MKNLPRINVNIVHDYIYYFLSNSEYRIFHHIYDNLIEKYIGSTYKNYTIMDDIQEIEKKEHLNPFYKELLKLINEIKNNNLSKV